MLSTSLLAQQVTNPPPASPIEPPAPVTAAAATPAPEPAAPAAAKTNAPPAKAPKKKSPPKKKPAPKKKEAWAELKTVPLVPGPAVVAANHVNVRGQPRLKSDILTRLTNGEPVIVLEEITRNNSAADEPSAWAKIVLPAGARSWVSALFVDATNMTVKPKKLNVRSGPGEQFSVVGQLQRGDAVKQLATKGDWFQIEPPTNACAYVAAQYLKQEPSAPAVVAVEPVVPAPTPATVGETPAIASTVTETPATTNTVAEAPGMTNVLAETADLTNAEIAGLTNAPIEEPPPPRIVQREGYVRGTVSIQASTPYGLYSPENGKLMNYLYTKSVELDLRRYKGMRIVVTGEEGLDERWPNTPVITIQKIQVLE
jgi:uncharacterized protein YgiM (DUF1202 family)